MKYIRYLIITLMVLAVHSVRANTVTLSSVTGHAGDEVTLAFAMSGSDRVTALEVVMPVGDVGKYVDSSVNLVQSRSDGHQITATQVGTNIHIYLYSTSLKSLKGDSGDVFTLRVALGKKAGDHDVTPEVVLSDASGRSLDCQVQGATVTIQAPMLEITSQTIDFGHVPIRSQYESSIGLYNSGNLPLTITEISTDDREIEFSARQLVVQPYSTEYVRVIFSPLLTGPKNTRVTVKSDASNGNPYGRWLTFNVMADPYSLNEIRVNPALGISDSEVEVTVGMNNMEEVVGAQMSFKLPKELVYIEGSAHVSARSVNHQVAVSLQGDMLTLIAYSIDNTPFKGENGDLLSFKLRLSGRSGDYWIEPTEVVLSNKTMQNVFTDSYGEYISIQSPGIIADGSIDFGRQSIDGSMTAKFSVYNQGLVPLVIDKISFLDEGYEVLTPLPQIIASFNTSEIEIRYTTSMTGDFSTTMNVYNNDPELRVLQVPVFGYGYPPNRLTLDGDYSDDRDSYIVHVMLDNYMPITALQFDITADPKFGNDVQPVVKGSWRMANHNCNVYDMGSGKWRVLIYSMINASIDPSKGTLLDLVFERPTDCDEVRFVLDESVLSAQDGTNVESHDGETIRQFVFNTPQSVMLDKATMVLLIGSKGQLYCELLPVDTPDKSIEWITDNASVATVNSNGTVTATGIGTTLIGVKTWNGLTATCEVTVTDITVRQVVLDRTSMLLRNGERLQLSATVLPDNVSDKSVVWSSSDTSVATVTSDGTVEAVGSGSASIYATCGNVTGTCEITCYDQETEWVSFSNPSIKLYLGTQDKLAVNAYPSNATCEIVSWASSCESVVTVDADGNVNAIGIGDATITIVTSNGLSASCAVTVIALPCQRIDLSETKMTLQLGASKVITAIPVPENTTDRTVTWSTSDASIVTVMSDGTVRGCGEGTAIITARCGDVTANCEVKVVPVEPESISLDHSTLDLPIGSNAKLTFTLMPANVSDKSVTWTSSDESVVTVSNVGYIETVNIGTAEVKVTTSNGLSTTCVVNVTPILAYRIALSQKELIMDIGETWRITANVYPENASDKTVEWQTSDAKVATVDDQGNITALSYGTATITAKCGELTAECQVSVRQMLADSIELDATSLSMKLGDSQKLTAQVLPEDTTDKSVTWTSTDTNVATVDGNGNVSAVGVGTTEITATTSNGLSATCTVTVSPIMAESIVLSQTELSLLPGQTAALTATVLPENATDKSVTWRTSDATVATVDSNGSVQAVGVGNAVITVSCGDVTAECSVKVSPIVAEGVVLSATSLSMKPGDSYQLTATVLPENTTDKSVTWTSTDTSVATVDGNGNVYAVGVGQAEIIVMASSGISASCMVTVSPIMAESIVLSQTELSLLLGQSASLTATVLPENTTDKSVTWRTSDSTVATVDSSGNVKAVGVGSAVITVSCGEIAAECAVKVSPIVAEGVVLSATSLSMKPGDSQKLTAQVLPEDTTDKSVTWTSTDTNVATVDGNGNVSAVGVGTTEITATTSNGLSATCTVTVSPIMAESIVLSQTELSLLLGQAAALTATVLPENTTDKSVTWRTSDATVATVDSNGSVQAVGVGSAVITVSCGDVTAECSVKVSPIVAEGVVLSATSLSMKPGDSQKLTAKVLPEDTTDKSVTWTSTDTSVATIDGNGNVYAVGVGQAEIIVTASSGVSASCMVTVSPIMAESIVLSQTELSLLLGQSAALTATVLPENTTDKSVTWRTSDSTVATVDSSGNVKAVGVGSAVIIASCGDVTAQCTVTVKPIEAESVVLNVTTLEIKPGDSQQLTVTVLPENTTEKSVVWTSSDPEVVVVYNSGIIRAVKPGESVITATTSNGLSASCTVIVSPIMAESVDINYSELSLYVGQTAELIATVYPENVTDKTVTWRSSDETIVTVDATGKVYAGKAGKASVYAEADGGAYGECQIEVSKKDNAIVWTQEFDGVKETDEILLTAYSTSGLEVTYEVTKGQDNAYINGKTLTITKAGEITITATQPGNDEYAEAQPISKVIFAEASLAAVNIDGVEVVVNEGHVAVTGLSDETSIDIVDEGGRIVYRGTDRTFTLQRHTVYLLRYSEGIVKFSTK